ncbi:MAG: NmrA family transcriptional regulator, partial [Flammeovirgaceae bacterium]|nr:NmrA family transcriptional regulator [Flammeovirgaceae bacterium]
ERKSEFHSELQGLENFYKAVKYSLVKKVIYLSSMLKDYSHWWVFEVKRQAEILIKNQEIPYTIFYPSSFMETIDKKLLVGKNIMLLGESKYPMYWIAAEDYGRQVAMSFKIHHSENKEFFVQGLEGLTLLNAAKKFTSHYPKKLNIKQFPIWLFRIFSFFSARLQYGLFISEALNNYKEEFLAENTWNELGKPEISIEEYARSLENIN